MIESDTLKYKDSLVESLIILSEIEKLKEQYPNSSDSCNEGEKNIEQLAKEESDTLYDCYPFPNDNWSYAAVRRAYVQGAKFGYIALHKNILELFEARIKHRRQEAKNYNNRTHDYIADELDDFLTAIKELK